MRTRATSRAVIGYAILALILALILNASVIYERISQRTPNGAVDVRWIIKQHNARGVP